MRLLFVGTNKGGGGTESHFVTLARAMSAAGHAVAAVVRPGCPIAQGLQGSGVDLYPGVFKNVFDPRGYRAVWRAARRFRADWIVGSFSKEYWPLAGLSHALGVPLALFKHMDFPMKPATRRFIPRLAGRFIVISDFMRERFIARGVPADYLQVLYNPLDLAYFQPDPGLRRQARAELGLHEDDVLAGFIGALHPGKGIFVLADALDQAMDRLPRLKALWVGEGPAAADFARRLAASPHAERHVRRGWSQDVRPFYAAMDLLAMPSIESDTFGRVSIEAQACGVPVLGSQLGGIPETMLPGDSGLLLPPGAVEAWRDAMLALAQDAPRRQRMGQAGAAFVRDRFSAPVIAEDFRRLLMEGQVSRWPANALR